MNLTAEHVYTPSELNREIKLHLEMGFPRVLLEAEISNLARPASGHLYFSLKDDRAQIRCAMFRSSARGVKTALENGMKVLAKGRISLYEPRGDYQFIIDSLQDAGEGLLQRQFEELKKKLDTEGLFDPARKQKIPPYALRIGLVTSPSGAVVKDLVHVLERRWPIAEVRLYPVAVQGNEAPGNICRAIESANRQAWANILIIGRGGGSLEDLTAFNDESVARCVFASDIPIISAVGHETDFSICDFVADLRAPTPSAAAELATPDQTVLRENFSKSDRQLGRRMQDRLQQRAQRVDHLFHRLQQRHPARQLSEQEKWLQLQHKSITRNISRQLKDRAFVLDALTRRLSAQHPDHLLSKLTERLFSSAKDLEKLTLGHIRSSCESLSNLARTLNAVSPLETIGRGYSVITADRSGEVISSVTQVKVGEGVSAQVTDGLLKCTITEIDE